MRDIYRRVFCEYMDMDDRETRNTLCMIDEADQTNVVLSLTQKLYETVVNKNLDIDFGTIPESKGDITAIDQYPTIIKTVNLIRDLLKQYKQPYTTIDEVSKAIDYLELNKDLFRRGFAMKSNIIEMTYNTAVLNIVGTLSYMVTTMVHFISQPGKVGYEIMLDKRGIARTKESLVYSNLTSMNNAFKAGEIKAAFTPIIRNKAKGFAGIGLGAIAMAGAGAAVLLNILPILRELTYFYYASNTRISQYFDLQADLLEMNAQAVRAGEVNSLEDKRIVAQKQEAIARRFRQAADFFEVNGRTAEKDSTKAMKQDNVKYKVNDVVDSQPDSAGGSLF